jgi:outer membrane protein assembly factor BamB
MRNASLALIVGLTLTVSAAPRASDYLTEGNDNSRTGWMKHEKVFTPGNVTRTRLLWKLTLDNAPREMHNLFPPLIVEKAAIEGGTREVAIVAGVSDTLFAIDVAKGSLLWKTALDTLASASGTTNTFCPGGQTAVPVIAPGVVSGQYVIHALGGDGRLHQVNLTDGKEIVSPEKFLPPGAKVFSLNLHNDVIYTTVAQGCGGVPNAFVAFDLKTRRSTAFLPGGGGQWGRRGPTVAEDGTVFMGTGDGPFNPQNRNLGNAVVAVKIDQRGQFQLTDYFGPKDANWAYKRDLDINVSPVAFDYRGQKFLVSSGKQCRVWLLDRTAIGGEDHRTPLDTSDLLCNEQARIDIGVWGSITAWVDAQGQQWIVVPFWGPVARGFHAPVEHSRPELGGVAAFKVVQQAGKWKLLPAWLSRNINMADETTVANGIVFTFGTGEDIRQIAYDLPWDQPLPPVKTYPGASAGSARRIMNSTHATLFALDALTGKELWSSGDQVTSFSHFGGLSVANGRIYLPTYDGTLYCFGVPR